MAVRTKLWLSVDGLMFLRDEIKRWWCANEEIRLMKEGEMRDREDV